MYHASDGLYFSRETSGDVTISQRLRRAEDGEEELVFLQRVDAGHWASAVLSMSAHGERPGDWTAWMEHHKGLDDIFEKNGR